MIDAAAMQAKFRRTLGQFATGVAVVAAAAERGPVGLAVGSFASVSLAPPLVGFAVDKESTSWPAIRQAARFCVNVLASDQERICRRFAVSSSDKFDGVGWHPGPGGSPVLDGSLATIACQLEREIEMGDHWFVLAKVEELDVCRDHDPLVFFRGGFGTFSPSICRMTVHS